MQETQVQSLGWENPLEKGMVTHSSILTWRIPWTEEPGGLPSIGSQRLRHNWSNLSGSINRTWSFLMVQWLRIHLATQGTRVQTLGPERSHMAWRSKAHELRLLKPVCLEPLFPTREATEVRSPCTAMESSPLPLQLDKACSQQRRPSTARNK